MDDHYEHGPLSGYRVVELGSMVAGPFCGRLLADFGAEVIKIEPVDGDPIRFMGSRHRDKSLYAASIMRNKKLLALDIRTPRGQEVVKRLVANSDFVLENFRPGTLEKWGLGYKDLKAVQPRIILIRISGFGQTGPYRERPGYGPIGEAISGLREITGDPDRPPPRMAVSLTDYISGLYGAFGAVMAALAREKTGEGQVIDTSLYEAGFSFMEPHIPAYAALGVIAKRAGSRLPNTTPNNLYPARDGYIHIAAVSQPIFRRFAELMERPELADDPRFATPLARNEHVEELEDIISAWTSRHDLRDLECMLIEAHVPAARIYTVKDIFDDPHFAERDMLLELPEPDLDTVTVTGIIPKLGDTPGKVRWLGRDVGADTHEILREIAGFDDQEIGQFLKDKIVRC
ncbi:MAG: CoA transferase [Hyphomicrobiaceae bacterium]|nr:CoA transferase [Hyphomicrobiaceae bacterium]